ncbi:polyprenyl synthetase family protein [Georgenia faecalis]|uniref:Polyprenyl synthetase family protein n=1 Tax=Georgenia faecalis TaxID=2483799 RepID=A0ABV9D511_9MICO
MEERMDPHEQARRPRRGSDAGPGLVDGAARPDAAGTAVGPRAAVGPDPAGTAVGPGPGDGADGAATVEGVLLSVLADAEARVPTRVTGYATLWDQLRVTVRGGKKFRGGLVVRTHDALGGRRRDAAVTAGAAFELLHAAFLVHDDLIDHDLVRRGVPNLPAVMAGVAVSAGANDVRAERFAEASAVLAGDAALSLAHGMFATLDVPTDVHRALQELLRDTVLFSVAGELGDVASGLGLWSTSHEDAMTVAESKTAMYSFRAPLRAGALIADAPDDVAALLDRVGSDLGRAFQLVDDLLGVFAPEGVIGKSNVSDLREGKATSLLLHARELPVWDEVRDHVGRLDLLPATADVVRGHLARSAAPARVADQVRDRLGEAADVVRAGDVPAPLAALLDEAVRTVGASLDRAWRFVESCR